MIKDLLKKHIFIIVFTVSGAVGGFLYWKFVGCRTGNCPIKSVWYMSTIWGLMIGYLSGSILKDFLTGMNKKNKSENESSASGDAEQTGPEI